MTEEFIPYKELQFTDYDWLPEVPKHWEKRSIRSLTRQSDKRNGNRLDLELLSVYREFGVIKKASRDDNHNVESLDLSNYKYVGKGCLVMNKMKMWQGSLGVSNFEGIVSPAYIVCSFTIDANLRYFHYLLRSATFKTHYNRISYGIRVGQWDMRYSDFKNLNLFIPPRPEQDQIVKFLDYKISRISKFIKAKKREIELFKEQIEFLCYNKSGDGKIVSNWENAFELNWKRIKANHLFEEINIKNCPDEELLAVTQNKGVVFKKDCSQNYVSPAGSFDGLKLVQKGDFVISLRSFQGGIEYSFCRGIVSPAYNVFHLKPRFDNDALRVFFRFLFKTKPFIELLRSLGGGIRDGKNISFSDFSQFYMPIPPEEHLEKITILSRKIDILEKQNIQLFRLMDEFKASLISEVVTGKIDVRDVRIEGGFEPVMEEETAMEEEISEEN